MANKENVFSLSKKLKDLQIEVDQIKYKLFKDDLLKYLSKKKIVRIDEFIKDNSLSKEQAMNILMEMKKEKYIELKFDMIKKL